MHRRGALFHWLLFAVLAAIGLFLIILPPGIKTSIVPGETAVAFVKADFVAQEAYAGAKSVVELEVNQVLLDLASSGAVSASCLVEGFAVWNKPGCVPDPFMQFSGRFSNVSFNIPVFSDEGSRFSIFSTGLEGQNLQGVLLPSGVLVVNEDEFKFVVSSKALDEPRFYSLPAHMFFDTGYDPQEFDVLFVLSEQLTSCSDEVCVKSVLNQFSGNVKVTALKCDSLCRFQAESPTKLITSSGERKPIVYRFAVRLSP